MTPAPPPPDPPPPWPTPRSAQVVLAVLAILLVGLLFFRGYGHRLNARPTEHHPAAVARQVDLNTAERAELMQVPGIGPALADAILSYRRNHGRFATVEDLDSVKGIGGKTLQKMRPWVKAGDTGESQPTEPEVERLERKPVIATTPAFPAGRTAKIRPGDPPIDVNTATENELQRLPGVGPVIARKIVEARGEGRFEVPDDLRRVRGIGPKTMDALRPFVICR
jgi:competence protein ComEA